MTLMTGFFRSLSIALIGGALGACDGSQVVVNGGSTGSSEQESISQTDPAARLADRVKAAIDIASNGVGISAFVMPEDGDYEALPQDPNNPITAAQVALGKMLFHDTAFALSGRNGESRTWSCATCHHAAAGFKAGVRQSIGNGGVGFGADGSERRLADGFDGSVSTESPVLPDFQLLASPSVLHSAWQDVMLWNGQFGNSVNGIVNAGIDLQRLTTPGTPKEANATGFSGVEVQAIAGTAVHRLQFEGATPLQNNQLYSALWKAAYGSQSVNTQYAAMAIAAYERTLLANRSPFQRWLRGEQAAMTVEQLRGAELFFGEAACSECHRGPGLASQEGAAADEIFFAIGFADLDSHNESLLGDVDGATRLGRGGFTGDPVDNYKFKIPQLYNLRDASVLGHGGSFVSVRGVIDYKNKAISQNAAAIKSLDMRFQPLSLSEEDLDALTAFILDALYDPDLARYQPSSVPSGACVVVDPQTSVQGLPCS